MSLIKKSFFSFSLLLLAVLSPLSGKEDHRVELQPTAIEHMETLPNTGILKQKENGFVYLDVPNEFITDVIPLLDHPGRLQPRPTASKSIGAHISVFHESENIAPEELNAPFSFSVKEIRSFTLNTRDGLKKLWVIAVNSPELESLRKSYGCSPKLKGYDFHITLGKQMPAAPANWEAVEALSAFNFSNEATLPLSKEGDFITVEANDILATVQKVDAVGQLKLKGNGFVYLDVNNDLIDRVWQKLPVQGNFQPISTKPKQMGAHISVIHEDEMIGKEIWNLEEAGQWFQFEVKELRYFERKSPKGVKKVWLLAADSPALQRLRAHYGLKSKLKGYDFHITLGSEELETPKFIETEDFFELDDELELSPAA